MSSLMKMLAAAAATATLAGGAVLAAAVPASASASFATPSGGGVVTQVVLDAGGYTKCLNDYGQKTAAGSPVKLYTCNSGDPASQWVTFPDNTLRPYLDPTMTLAVVSNHTVLEPVSGADTTQRWFFRADGAIVSGTTTAGMNDYVLNDPGWNTASGTQLILWDQPAATGNAHWWATRAQYGTGSTLSNRPDSGGSGGNWANDHMTRLSLVIFQGDVSGAHQYQGSVDDNGTFHGLAGADTPNQGCAGCTGLKMADSIGGTLTGSTGYSFTTDKWVGAWPASAYSGSNPTTGSWYKLFFPAGTAFGGTGLLSTGPTQWAWSYTSGTDNCGHIEHWLDAQYDSAGQGAAAGNITAPAAGSCS